MHKHSSSSSSRFSVAICGGGVGGLTLAVALSRHPDIRVDVYESAAKFAEVGAGVGIWPRTWRIMQALGLSDDLSQVTNSTPEERESNSFTFRKADEPEGRNYYTLTTPGGLIPFHRPDFQAVLLRHLSPRVSLHTSKNLASYTSAPSSSSSSSSTPLVLHFADGSSAQADVLVGADGIKSAVRREMYEGLACRASEAGAADLRKCKEPQWSGMWAYRAVVPMEIVRTRVPGHRVTREPMMYMGKDAQFTIYPIARSTMLNFASFRARYELKGTPLPQPWDVPASSVDLHSEFPHMEPEIQGLFDVFEHPRKWAVHTVGPLPRYVDGHAALLGDAAHAMMPFQGSGAGQAIEDAYLLATLLGHPACTAHTLHHALHAYDVIRRPFSQYVARVSADAGQLYTFNFPGMDAQWIAEAGDRLDRLRMLAERVQENWQWAWASSVDGDVRNAVEIFEEATGSAARGSLRGTRVRASRRVAAVEAIGIQ